MSLVTVAFVCRHNLMGKALQAITAHDPYITLAAWRLQANPNGGYGSTEVSHNRLLPTLSGLSDKTRKAVI